MELEEASLILNTASEKSLVLLDELGRGTATHDGTAIAKSVLGHLLNKIKCATLFVTHFKSLTQVFAESQVISKHMGFMTSPEDESDDVLFLYKLNEGASKNSFGINVAKMAEIPDSIVQHASELSDFYEILCNESLNQ